MTHGGPIHDLGKSALAMHVTTDHEIDGRFISVVYPPLAQLRRLRLDELQNMHRDLHEAASAVRDAAWPTAPGIPVPDAFEGLAASRTAAGGPGSIAPVAEHPPARTTGAPSRRSPHPT